VAKEQQRFKAAVERKSRDAEAASGARKRGRQDEEGAVQGDREGLRGPSQLQDSFSARDRSTRRRKATADKWNP